MRPPASPAPPHPGHPEGPEQEEEGGEEVEHLVAEAGGLGVQKVCLSLDHGCLTHLRVQTTALSRLLRCKGPRLDLTLALSMR